jgi:hypothetical protein
LPEMNFDRNQLISALILVATALFLMSGMRGFRHRRAARFAVLTVYGATVLGVAVYVVLWLCGIFG